MALIMDLSIYHMCMDVSMLCRSCHMCMDEPKYVVLNLSYVYR
jgi:hypothetical protein